MEDFGETLVDIRDHLSGPLPIRVRPLWLFTKVLATTVSTLFLTAFRRRRPQVFTDVPAIEPDLRVVLHEFDALKGKPCSHEQIAQAQEVFQEIMARLQARNAHERFLWLVVTQAALFLGTLIFLLLLTSIMMCVFTQRPLGEIICIALLVVIQTVVGTACLILYR